MVTEVNFAAIGDQETLFSAEGHQVLPNQLKIQHALLLSHLSRLPTFIAFVQFGEIGSERTFAATEILHQRYSEVAYSQVTITGNSHYQPFAG